jgi:hypothetical protein
MNFVLAAVRPSEGEAKYGKALVPEQDPFTTAGSAIRLLIWIFSQEASVPVTLGEAREIGRGLIDAPGREIRHSPTGLTFRIDPADKAPHACPCCGRLVLPEDHAYAAAEDAYCLGCFTWDRNTPACLPANSAHTRQS